MKIQKITIPPDINFTLVSNELIYDTRISAEARLVHIYLLSRPDGWEAWRTDVMKKCNLGKDKYQRIMRELRDVGYVELIRGGKGGGNAIMLSHTAKNGGFSGVRETRLPSNTASVKQGHIVSTDSLVSTDNILNTERYRSFERFWEKYPRKVGKKKAQLAFGKCTHPVDALISDVLNRIQHDEQWKDPKFIPHPATYLNGEKWNDELTPKVQSAIQSIWKHNREFCEDEVHLDGNDGDVRKAVDRGVWLDGGGELLPLVAQPVKDNH